MLKKHAPLILTALYINDILAAVLSWILSYYIRFYSGLFPFDAQNIQPLKQYLIVSPFIAVIWPIVFNFFRLYITKRNISLWKEFFDIVMAVILATAILLSLGFFYRSYVYSRSVVFIFVAMCIFLTIFTHAVGRKTIRFLRTKGFNLKNVLIIGAGELGLEVAKKIEENPWAGFNIVGLIDDYKPVGIEINGKRILGKITDLTKCISAHKVDQIFIALPLYAYRRLYYVIRKLQDEAVDVRVVPDINRVFTLNASVEDFNGMPLINLSEGPIYGLRVIVKRILDIIVSAIAIILTAPFMISAAVLIKMTSMGPILFRQKRYGLGGKRFVVYKFRSMHTCGKKSAGIKQAVKNDARVTPLGRFIRKTSIDELPQFFNVLKGDMSIVGPRPHPLSLDRKHRQLLETYMWRYKVKPGITGWAQANGWRGETDTLDKMQKRIEYDLYYIRNWSVWLDMKIMWLTIWKGLISKHAY